MASECPVCLDPFTAVKRKPVICPGCSSSCCVNCFQQYLLKGSLEPKCMNCPKQFTFDWMIQNLPVSFVEKDWKERRSQLLFEMEKALLPQSQKPASLYRKWQEKKKDPRKIALDEEMARLRARMTKIKEEVRSLDNEVWEAKHDFEASLNNPNDFEEFEEEEDSNNDGAAEKKERKQFTFPCADNNCKGYLSTRWKCGICEKITCRDCHELKNDNHVCNPDILASVKAIADETRPCPKCHARVYKVSGCNAMWCTLCHTFFDYTTGNIIHHAVHNPHHAEWERGDTSQSALTCGLPTLSRLVSNVEESTTLVDAFRSLHHIVNHLSTVEIDQYVTVDLETLNRDLRVKFLIGEIDENSFKTTLRKREKDFNRRNEIHGLLIMFTETASAFFNDLISRGKIATYEIWAKLVNLVDYTNSYLSQIAKLYKSKTVPRIGWDQTRMEFEMGKWN